MRRRDFIKGIGGATASWPVTAYRWLGVATLQAPAQFVAASSAMAQDATTLPVEIVPRMGHAENVARVAFSPDGRTIISGSDDKTLKLWEVASGREVRTFRGHSKAITAVAFSPDGRTVVSASYDETLKLWVVASGRALQTFARHDDGVRTVAFSPDGRTIVSGGQDETLKLWDVSNGSLLRTFRGHKGSVNNVAFSPDGRIIASLSFDDTLKLWDSASGRTLQTYAVNAGLASFGFAPDGRTLVLGTYINNRLNLRDAATGRELGIVTRQHATESNLAFSPDGTLLAATNENSLDLRDAASGRNLHTLAGHTNGVSVIAFSPDGRTIVSGSADQTLKLWDVASGRELRTFTAFGQPINAAEFSPDGTNVVSGGHDNTLKMWDAANGRVLRTLTGHGREVLKIAFSPDGLTMVSGSGDNTLKLWDTASGRELRTLEGHSEGVQSVSFSPDGRSIVSASWDMTLKLWDTASGRLLRTFSGHTLTVTCVAFSPNGRTVVSGGWDKSLKLWDVASGRTLRTMRATDSGPDGYIEGVAFSPDGRTIAGAHGDSLELWDAASGRGPRTLKGHGEGITAVAFSPDGRTIISGSQDTTVKLWDVASGRALRTFTGHSGTVFSVAFSPDGRTIVSGSYDTTIRRWNLAGDLLTTSTGSADGEWLTITPEGFFDSSEKGAQSLSAVRGLAVYSIDQFYQQLYRPDVVRQKLSMDLDLGGRVKTAARNVNLGIILASKAPPDIAIVSPATDSKTGERSITVEANLADRGSGQGGGIGRIEWRVNDVTRAVRDLQHPPNGAVTKIAQKLALPEGTSEIKVVAYNKANLAASLPAAISVTVNSPSPRPKPRLHVLAVGVNDYRDPYIRRLNYSVSDANSVAAAFLLAKSDDKIYDDVFAHGPLLNAEVTAKKLQTEFERLSAIVQPDDVFVLYVAGHGVTDNGRYYFVSHDAKTKDGDFDVETCIGQDRLQQWLTLIPAFKSVLIYDTCESGSTAEDRSAFRSTQQFVAAEKLSRSMGRTVLSATSDVKDALEGYPPDANQKHGIFTYVLLDGLALADANKDGQVTTEALAAYLQKHLPVLTQNLSNVRQEPQVKLSGAPFVLMQRIDIADINKLR